MKKTLFYLFAAGLFTLSAEAAHTGRVFVDRNGNGVSDKGERPLAGVAVSDGLHVVRTAADGSFTLPGHARERFLFITTPSGYKTNNNHYRLIQAGTEAYQFALQPYEAGINKEGAHRFVHISDTEIFNTENNEVWANNIRDYASNEQPAFIIHTGDICYEKGLTNHIQLMNTRNMNCPIFYCIGNHDLVKGKYGEELFESLYGPTFYSFDAGSVHYIVTPMLGGDHSPGYTKADVYHWLKNDLAQQPAGKPIMMFNHDLLTNGNSFIYGISESEQIDLNAHNLKAWLYGHWHINFVKQQGNVYTVGTSATDKGGIDHSTGAFRVMHVDRKGDFTSELRYPYLNKQLSIASPVAGQQPAIRPDGGVPLVVNSYSTTSPVQAVSYTCRVNGAILFENRPLTQATDWSWLATLPLTPQQEGKEIHLVVKSRFHNGEVAEARSLFVYRATSATVKPQTEWTNLLGNPQHAALPIAGPDTTLRLAWTTNIGANIYLTSPLVHQGKVFTASVDENLKGEAHVYALDAKSGQPAWKYKVRNSIKNSIAIVDNSLFAQDAEGYLYALDCESGALKWEKKLPMDGLPALIDGLVAANGVVYAGTGESLCALDSRTGKELWRNTEWRRGEGTTSTHSLGAGVLVAGGQWRGLYANDATTGKLRWSLHDNGLRNRGASAAIHGNLLYIVSDKSMFVIDAPTGKVVVRRELPFSVDATSTPLLTEGEIVFGTATTGLVALNRETMDVKWQFRTGSALVYTAPYSSGGAATIETSPVAIGNTIYVAASDGTLYGIGRKDGQLRWKHATGAPLFSSVAVSGNSLIVSDFGGNLYAFTFTE